MRLAYKAVFSVSYGPHNIVKMWPVERQCYVLFSLRALGYAAADEACTI